VSLTLAALLHRSDLGLQLRLGEPGLQVTWVHISDLADPTPYLEAGCMLLTTGLSIAEDGDWSAYVAGLVAAGVSALGFGVGLRHRRIPDALLSAALDRGLAIVEVPERTRFSEVIHAVVEIGARSDRAQHALTLERHRELLNAAAVSPAPRSLALRLAEQLQAWVLVFGTDAQLLAASTDAARQHLDRVRDEVLRAGPSTSGRFDLGADRVTVLPVGVSDRPAGWIAVGRRRALTAAERSVVDATVALLRLDAERAAELRATERRERRAVLGLLRSGDALLAARMAAILGVAMPEGPVRVAVLRGADNDELLETVERSRQIGFASALVAADDGLVIVVTTSATQGVRALRRAVAATDEGRAVVGEPVELADVAEQVKRLSVLLALVRDPGLVLSAELNSDGLVARLDTEAGRGWAMDVLGSLLASGSSRVDLSATVRTFLAHNGGGEAAAAALVSTVGHWVTDSAVLRS
jgi:purine catabolism regulator